MGSPQGQPPRKELFLRLLSLSRPELRSLLLGTFFLFVGSSGTLFFPQAVRLLLDEALSDSALENVNQIALAMAGILLLQGAAVALRVSLFNLAGESIVNRLRERLYRSLLEQEIGFFDQHRTGDLTSRLASDTAVLQGAVSIYIAIALRNVTTVLGGLALLFYTSPRLTLVMLAVVPVVTAGALLYGRRVRLMAREAQDALANANEVAAESLAGIRTVQSFVAEEHEARNYAHALARAFEVTRRRVFASGIFTGAAGFAGYTAAILVFWYGTRLVVGGALTMGGLTSFLMYTLMVVFAFGALSDLWAEVMKASGAAERVFELIDRKPAVSSASGERPQRLMGQLEFQGVSFSYPTRKDVPVLREVDLQISPGEVIAFVGQSGAGKSTIASLLIRFYDPDRGRILLDGRELRELDPHWLRRQIAIVSQEPLLFSGTIADNIRYGREDATDAEVEAAAHVANAHDFIRQFPQGYRTLVGERGVQLSGGQKQRVAIARAVLKQAQVLILDEATSALDAENEHLVKEALARLQVGRTTLIIAHRLSSVTGAHRILVLDQGRVIQSGTHADLVLQDGLYRRLVEHQLVAA
jgi:ATP-binding cassette subfamily B protein